MKRQNQLIHLEKWVIANEMSGISIQSQFFLYFAQDRCIGRFPFFQKTSDQPEHVLRPAPVTRQNHRALDLDDGRDHRNRVVPVDITAIHSLATQANLAVNFGALERVATLQTKFGFHGQSL